MKLISKEGHVVEVNDAHGEMMIATQRGNWKAFIEKVEEVAPVEQVVIHKQRGRPRK